MPRKAKLSTYVSRWTGGGPLWAESEAFSKRDLSEHAIAYLYVDGIAERLRPV